MTKQTDPTHDRPVGKSRNPAKKKRKPNSSDGQLGESIRAHRLILGMSQSELAKQLGVSFQQVQKYEKGTNRIGAGRLPQIAEIFDVPITTLFGDYADISRGKGKGRAAPAKLITDATVLKLLTAYADISDRSIRSCLGELVELIARSARKESWRQSSTMSSRKAPRSVSAAAVVVRRNNHGQE
ncbi:helix-turn-helix domain-containing protein [Bradyrhizobium sp.]|uniref:helix-turn-helix domain-containing protein n=1 Tax=Bradyrhizobium sp. TaxID=376 RepID=UPI00403782C0